MPTKVEARVIIYQMHFGLPKYLLVHLRNWEWGFPKGELAESDQSAATDLVKTAVQAAKQQTNLDVKITSGFQRALTYQPRQGGPRKVTFFISRVKPHVIVTPPRKLVMDYGWFDYRTAYRTIYYDNLRDVFYAANRTIRGL